MAIVSRASEGHRMCIVDFVTGCRAGQKLAKLGYLSHSFGVAELVRWALRTLFLSKIENFL